MVNGSVVNASVVASGVASVYLVGLENLAQVNLAGSANLYVEPSSGAHPLHAPCIFLKGCKGQGATAQQ